MHIEFLVEELSAEAALNSLAPAILGPGHTFQVHPHNGKPDLIAKLPDRLRGYRPWLPADWRIVVLMDADEGECLQLKARMEDTARAAGLVTRSAVGGAQFQVLNRLAVQELEAWFFGDVEALCAAYPRLDPNLAKRSRYRNPDAIAGGTWEALEHELQRRRLRAGRPGQGCNCPRRLRAHATGAESLAQLSGFPARLA